MRTLADRQRERRQADADDRDLTSRSDRRREQNERETALKRLARRLVGLKAHQLASLALGEELLEAVNAARAIRSANALNRQIGVVRQQLRDLGDAVTALEAAVDRATGVGPVKVPVSVPKRTTPAELWAERLVREGDAAQDELAAGYPALDRQQLRQQVRTVVKARSQGNFTDAARAERRLQRTLEGIVGSGGEASPAESQG